MQRGHGPDLLSLSFLDGLIVKLLESQQLDSVTFVAANAYSQHKLVQVAGIRQALIFYRAGKDAPRQWVEPQMPRQVELRPRRKRSLGKIA